MARTNQKTTPTPAPRTHEGAIASRITAEQELARSVMGCMLFEDTFYESGEDIYKRIAAGVHKVRPEFASMLAAEARQKMNLRHVPLAVARELCRGTNAMKRIAAETINQVIQRPDELAEFVALYNRDKRQPLSAQAKKGLAQAFTKFDEYGLAKYNQQDRQYKLRDVLFLCHAKPKDAAQQKLWERLIAGELQTPDTWEVALSACKTVAEKKQAWTRLLAENKLGALALIRNLRNMEQAGVDKKLVHTALANADVSKVFPYRFLAADRHAPGYSAELEDLTLRSAQAQPKLKGHTVIVVDNSGSMYSKVSGKSEIDRVDAAAGVAIIAREVCEQASVVGYGDDAKILSNARGFRLRDAIKKGPGGGTDTARAIKLAQTLNPDRIIVITDEQSHTTPPKPGCKGYIINVAPYKQGIGYGDWCKIDGWSDRVLDYIRMYEDLPNGGE